MGLLKPRRLSDAKGPFVLADKKAPPDISCWLDEQCGGRLGKVEIISFKFF